MPHDLGRALLLSDAVSPNALAEALFTSVRDGVSLVRALVSSHAIDPEKLEEELARTAPDVPVQKHPVPLLELMDKLPPRLCEALLAIPVRRDPRTGTIDVALADPNDAHAAEEIAFFLGAPVRAVRSPVAALEAALARMRSVEKMRAAASSSRPPPTEPMRPRMQTPSWEAPVIDASVPSARDAIAAMPSERPVPVVVHASDPPPARHASQPEGSAHDIPIPLSRRVAPPDSFDEDAMPLTHMRTRLASEGDDPVMELRRVKTPPPFEAAAISTVASTPMHQLMKEMGKLGSRDPLGELLLITVRPVAHKAALFAVKKEAFVGWMCTSDFGDRGLLAQTTIPVHAPTFLSAAASVGQYVGPLVWNDHHAPLFPFFSTPRTDVIAVAIRAAGRPAVILVAHDVADPIKAMPVLHEVARVAGETLERILLQTRSSPSSRRTGG